MKDLWQVHPTEHSLCLWNHGKRGSKVSDNTRSQNRGKRGDTAGPAPVGKALPHWSADLSPRYLDPNPASCWGAEATAWWLCTHRHLRWSSRFPAELSHGGCRYAANEPGTGAPGLSVSISPQPSPFFSLAFKFKKKKKSQNNVEKIF